MNETVVIKGVPQRVVRKYRERRFLHGDSGPIIVEVEPLKEWHERGGMCATCLRTLEPTADMLAICVECEK